MNDLVKRIEELEAEVQSLGSALHQDSIYPITAIKASRNYGKP